MSGKTDVLEGKSSPTPIWPAIAAALPAAFYLVAFAYEAGYASYFGIPLDWISLTLTDVFVTGAAIVLAFLPLYNVFAILYYFIPSLELFNRWATPSPIRRAFARGCLSVVIVLVFVTTLLYFSGATWTTAFKTELQVLVVSSAYFFLEFGLPFFTQRDQPTLAAKLEAQERLDSSVEGFNHWLGRTVGDKVVSWVWGALFGLGITFLLGQKTATTRHKFLVRSGAPRLVLLRTYGSLAVAGVIDEAKPELIRGLMPLNLINGNTSVFSLEDLGPLVVSTTPTKLSEITLPSAPSIVTVGVADGSTGGPPVSGMPTRSVGIKKKGPTSRY